MLFGSVYMLNHLPQSWVKNVYSLWAQGVVNRAKLYTTLYINPATATTLGVKPSFIPQLVNTFPPESPTAKITQLTDTFSQLPTVSTAPTIKKKR